jgi:hypothetical protein
VQVAQVTWLPHSTDLGHHARETVSICNMHVEKPCPTFRKPWGATTDKGALGAAANFGGCDYLLVQEQRCWSGSYNAIMIAASARTAEERCILASWGVQRLMPECDRLDQHALMCEGGPMINHERP